MTPVATDDVYLELLTLIVQRFVALMGDPALRLARQVQGVQVREDGVVTSYRVDGMFALQGILLEYMDLLGPQAVSLSQRAITPVLARNPSVKLPGMLQ